MNKKNHSYIRHQQSIAAIFSDVVLLNMDKFLLEQKQLLGLEREAELEESRLLQANVSLKELCGKGVAIQKLVIVGQATGLYGRLIVSFGSRHHGQ